MLCTQALLLDLSNMDDVYAKLESTFGGIESTQTFFSATIADRVLEIPDVNLENNKLVEVHSKTDEIFVRISQNTPMSCFKGKADEKKCLTKSSFLAYSV